MKKYLSIALCLVIMLSAVSVFASAANEYVSDGLIGRFSGSQYSGTKWTDLSGKGNDIDVVVDADSKFVNGAYLNSSIMVEFPEVFAELVASEEWTLELQFGDIESVGTDWNTFVNTKVNDAFALFRHNGNDNFILKNVREDGENPRPIANVGLDGLKNATIAITFKVGGDCIIYINGVEEAKTAPTGTINAGELYFGHDDAAKSHNTEYKAFRFYDRALNAAEVAQNYQADKAGGQTTTDPDDKDPDDKDPDDKNPDVPQTSDNGFVFVMIAFASIIIGAVSVTKVRR